MEFLHCIIYLASMGILVFLIGRYFPRKWILENKFPFCDFKFEDNGLFYERIFKIKKWKTKWPDASMILHKFFPKHYPKKRIERCDKQKIPVLIKESCIAESTHVIAGLLGFLCIKIWKKSGGIVLSITWALFNLPPILIQRYNRPRLKRALLLIK